MATFVGLAVVAFGWAWSLSGESLWLDELHSSWVISDEWAQVAIRAHAGNQSPTYFYGLKLTQQLLTGGGWPLSSEAVVRLPSMIAWSLTVAIFGWLLIRVFSGISGNCPNAGQASYLVRGERIAEVSDLTGAGGVLGRLRSRCSAPLLALVAGCCVWLLVDRLQCFYATEARGYSIIQALGLVTWILAAQIVAGHRWRSSWSLWNLLAPLMMHLHITAALVVCCQWLTLGISSLSNPRGRLYFFLTSIWLGLNAWLVLRPMGSVWDRRSQWAAFAGDASLTTLLSQFPTLAALIPIALLAIIQQLKDPPAGTQPTSSSPLGTHPTYRLQLFLPCLSCLCRRGFRWGHSMSSPGTRPETPLPVGAPRTQPGTPLRMDTEPAGTQQSGIATREGTPTKEGTQHITAQHITAEQAADPMGTQHFAAERSIFAEVSIWLWALAALGPIAIAWILTGLAGIPIFHYRFLIGSAVPLYVLLAIVISRLNGYVARWLSVAFVFVLLAVSQGTARHWYYHLAGSGSDSPHLGFSGYLMGSLRGEGWREATAYIAERLDADAEAVWCSSGLIEARNLRPPLTEFQHEYLTFPFRGIYRFPSPQTSVGLSGLVGQSQYWQGQLFGSNEEPDCANAVWIIHRGTPDSLNGRLARAGLAEQINWTEIQEFGGVSVIHGRLRKSD